MTPAMAPAMTSAALPVRTPRVTSRGGKRALTCALAAVAALCLATSPAAAKSGVVVTVVPVSVNAGGVAASLLSVSASGGDDAAGMQKLCLQQRSPSRKWRTLTCGRVELGTGGNVQAEVQRRGSGRQYFRAELDRVPRGVDTAPVLDLTSPVTAYGSAARSMSGSMAQWHRTSRSAVSFRSKDSGIATASVVRLK